MTFRNTSNNKHIDIRIVSLAAGLALATAAVIGGSDLLKENNTSKSTAPVTAPVERTAPQFSTIADAAFASQGIRGPSEFGTMVDAVYAAESIRPQTASVDINDGSHLGLGQPAVSQSFANMADAVYAVESLNLRTASGDIDGGEYLGLGQPAVGQSFANMADAVYAVQSVVPEQEVASAASVSSTNLDNFLGLGQPGEGTRSEPQFATMADADYASR